MEVATAVEVENSTVESNQTASGLNSNVNQENENADEVDVLIANNVVQEGTSLTNDNIGSSVNDGTTSISPETNVTQKIVGSSKTRKDGEVHFRSKKIPKAGLSQSLSFPSNLRKSTTFSKQTVVDVKNSHLSSSQRINGGTSAKLTAGTKKAIPVKSGSVDNRPRSYPIKSNDDGMKPLKHTLLGKKEKDNDANSTTSTTPSTTPSGAMRRKSAGSGFSFRLDERAQRRKEYFAKLEEKIHAKEIEKTNLQEKSKESHKEEIRRLRKSLTFKATPLPSFYQEPGPPKVELKKIPITRPISPKLGRNKPARAIAAINSFDIDSNTNVNVKENSSASKKSTQKSQAKLPSLKSTPTSKPDTKPKPKISSQKPKTDKSKEENSKLTGEELQTEQCTTAPGGFESVVGKNEAIEPPNDATEV